MLCGDTSLLPMLETRKAAAIGIGTAIGVAAIAGIVSRYWSKEDENESEDKDEENVSTEDMPLAQITEVAG